MKTKEVKYHDSDGSLIREKLMVRRIVEGIADQTGMSAGRNYMEWKSRRREVPQWLEPSLLNEASAE